MNQTIREGLEIICENGAVAAGPVEAAQAGAAILAQGGNAFDAAAAACLACAVMQPQQIDLGGYVLAAVLREGATGRIWSLDANTTAPAAATADMFRTHPVRSNPTTYLDINEREYGCTVEGDANLYGPLAVSVPGFIAGVGTLSERWGQLPWPQIIAPARTLVAAGMPYSHILSDVVFKREAIAALSLHGEVPLTQRLRSSPQPGYSLAPPRPAPDSRPPRLCGLARLLHR